MLVAPLVALALAASPTHPCGPGAVTVTGGRYHGSGVVWDVAARRVLTALHVVEEMPADAVVVHTSDGGAWPARVVDVDPALDLALLEVAGPPGVAPPVGASASLAAGAPVQVARGGTAACTAATGRVLASSRRFAGSRYLSVAVAVSPGASGGPVLDERGALVGVVDLALLNEPGTALAVPVERAAARFGARVTPAATVAAAPP